MITTQHLTAGALAVGVLAVAGAVVAGDSIALADGENGAAPFPALAISAVTDSDVATGFVSFDDGWAMAEAYSFTGVIDTYLVWEGDVPAALEPYVWVE